MFLNSDYRWECTGGETDFFSKEQMKHRRDAHARFNAASGDKDTVSGINLGPRVNLWHNIWYDGDICCLFSDTNLGKSILAVQIADEVSRRFHRNVLYYDFEQSLQQFSSRYSTKEGMHHFTKQFIRVTPVYDNGVFDSYDAFFAIKHVIRERRAPFLIIDNLSALCTTSYSPAAFGAFVTAIWKLQRLYDLSILILAHTSKHSPNRALGINDLAFSRAFINHCDSAFAIGQSVSDPDVRYIKQIKDRTGNIIYGKNNVIPCKISRVDYGLRFVEDECCAESSLIGRQCLPPDKVESIRLLASLQGASKRLIAKVVGVSPATVSKIIGKYGAKEVPEEDEATPNPQNPQNGIEESDAEFEEITEENPSQAEPEKSEIVCEASNREHPRNASAIQEVTSELGVQTHEVSSTPLVPQTNPQTGIEESDAEFEEIPAESLSQTEPEKSEIVCEPSNREHPCNLSDAHGVTSKSGVQTHEVSSTALALQTAPQTATQIIPKLSDIINTIIFKNKMLKKLLNQSENYAPGHQPPLPPPTS
jgi:transposase